MISLYLLCSQYSALLTVVLSVDVHCLEGGRVRTNCKTRTSLAVL